MQKARYPLFIAAVMSCLLGATLISFAQQEKDAMKKDTSMSQMKGGMKGDQMKMDQGMVKGKERFLVITTHDHASCLQAMDAIEKKSPKLLKESWFGCPYGDHTVYTIVDAKGEDDAKQMLPDNLRDNAKVVPVQHLTAKEIRKMHKEGSKM